MGTVHHQDIWTMVPEGNSVCSSQLHIWCCPIPYFHKYPSFLVFLQVFLSSLAFLLSRVRSSCMHSPRRMLQGNLNQTTQIKVQARRSKSCSRANTARLPAHALVLWLVSCPVLWEQVKDVAFLLSPPQPALSKEKTVATCHGSGLRLGKQVLLAFPP